jgi:hypothetical protein
MSYISLVAIVRLSVEAGQNVGRLFSVFSS